MEQTTGWLPDGFTAWVFLVAWVTLVALHGIWRSLGDAEQDPIRPAGPMGGRSGPKQSVP